MECVCMSAQIGFIKNALWIIYSAFGYYWKDVGAPELRVHWLHHIFVCIKEVYESCMM